MLQSSCMFAFYHVSIFQTAYQK